MLRDVDESLKLEGSLGFADRWMKEKNVVMCRHCIRSSATCKTLSCCVMQDLMERFVVGTSTASDLIIAGWQHPVRLEGEPATIGDPGGRCLSAFFDSEE